ncbi:MAG: dockerin type I repeat-containing protein [Oscillospiraceae bacterium]|nr:dockerin type I repeat-containing protein [Oscillospiraceae bacterium]
MKKKLLSVLTAFLTALPVFSAVGFTAMAEEATYPETFSEYTQLKEDYPEMYRIDEDSIYFINQNTSNASMSLIVSSNQNSDVTHNTYGCIFTPDTDGRYVVTAEEFREEIVGVGSTGHFHYFYPVTVNYVVDVENGEFTVENKGTVNWYSESQISEEIEEAEKITAESGEVYSPMCSDVLADGAEDIIDENYFSFVNGQLPCDENGFNSYITNVYNEYSTKSYFCVNTFWSDIIPVEPRVRTLNSDIVLNMTEFITCSYLDGNYELGTDDIMQLFRVEAPEDGNITIISDKGLHNLTVKNSIFHNAEEVQLSTIKGDINNDGELAFADIIGLHKYLTGTGDITCVSNADLNGDGKINVFDICIMKRILLDKKPVLTTDTTFIGATYIQPTVTFTLDANNYWLPASCDALPTATLYNADTNEPVAQMEHQGDNIWTCTVEIDNSDPYSIYRYNYYALVNGKDGSSGYNMKSNTVYVDILIPIPIAETDY